MKPLCELTFVPYIDLFLLNSEMLAINSQFPQTHTLLLEDDLEKKKEKLFATKTLYIHAETYDEWSDLLIELQPPIRLILISGTDFSLEDEHIEALVHFMPDTQFWIRNWMGSLLNCTLLPIGTHPLYTGPIGTHTLYTGPIEKKYMFGITYLSLNGDFRKEFYDFMLSSGNSIMKYQLAKCEQEKFYEKLSCLRFSVCPMGNGYDTLRFWECLVLRCIPIVKDHKFYDVLLHNYPGLPFIRVKEWTDLPDVVNDLSEDLYEEMMKNADLNVVWEEYWLLKIESACREERVT